jgi:hypothetical protein
MLEFRAYLVPVIYSSGVPHTAYLYDTTYRKPKFANSRALSLSIDATTWHEGNDLDAFVV